MQNEDAANLSDRSNALYDYLANNPGADIQHGLTTYQRIYQLLKREL